MGRWMPSLLRSTDPEEEDRFREYLDPEVSLRVAGFYAATTLIAIVSVSVDDLQGASVVVRVSLLVFFLSIVFQVALAILHRQTKQTRWLFAADILILIFKFWISVLSEELSSGLRSQNCDRRSVFYERESSGPFWVANCERQLRANNVLTTVLIVLIRQRFAHVVVSSVLSVALLLLMVPIQSADDLNPALRWIEIVFITGVLSLCCYVRYLLEVTDRAQYKTQEELKEYHKELRQVSKELSAELKQILPGKLLERSSTDSRRLLQTDRGREVIVLQVGFHDVNSISRSMAPVDVAIAFGVFHSLAFDLAEKSKTLERIHVIHDQCLVVGNLLSRASSVAGCLHEACTMALTLVQGEHRTVAAIHIGEASGAFTGRRFVRYDVRGPALEMCDQVMQLCGPNEALVTEEVNYVLRDVMVTTESGSVPAENTPIATLRLETVRDFSDASELTSSTTFSNGTVKTKGASGTSSNDGSAGGEFNVATAARVAQEGVRIGEGESAADDNHLSLETAWCCFSTFPDERVEAEYLEDRADRLLQRASSVWIAYAAFLLLMLVLLLADYFETTRSNVAAVLLTLCILAAAGISFSGARIRQDPEHKLHFVWSCTALLVPLGVVFALAMARPSIVGNDMRPFVMIGALMRTPILHEARHQLVVIPLFLVLSQLHLIFPGAVLRAAELWAWIIVLFTITSDSRQDRVERQHFVNKKRIVEALKLLREERNMREGLVRCQLPGAMLDGVSTGVIGRDVMECRRIPDTIVVLLNLGSADKSLSHASLLLSLAEELEQRAPQLHVAKIVGSAAMLTNAIMDLSADEAVNLEERTLLALLKITSDHPMCSALVDIDSVIQRVSTVGLPSYDVLGPAVGRLHNLRATGTFVSGTFVTDRVVSNVRSEMKTTFKETLMPPVRIRGVGLVRMTKVSSDAD